MVPHLLRSAIAAAAVLLLAVVAPAAAVRDPEDGLPAYLYGEAIPVECMNRNPHTGEHTEKNHMVEWIPFPTCNETDRPLQFHYGHEGDVNCTIALVSDPFFHLLEFYIQSDAPLACRLPARPTRPVEVLGAEPDPATYVPLVFALAGTLQLGQLRVAAHLNVLLHSTPHAHGGKTRPHDSGALDSAIAYSTGTLSHMAGPETDARTRAVVMGDPLPLSLTVRWLPGPRLPHTDGRVEWIGLSGSGGGGGSRRGGGGGAAAGWALWWVLVGFLGGAVCAGAWSAGRLVSARNRGGGGGGGAGKGMGGATPLGHGLSTSRLGNGWGYAKKKEKE